MIYINTFILTPNVLSKYDDYMTSHHLQSSGDEQEIIKFLINNLKGVKLRKNEKKFFETVKNYADMVEQNQKDLLSRVHTHVLKKNLQAKLINSIRLTNFVNKYIFYVEHLKNDFHYLDYDEEAETPNLEIDEDHYRMKHKNFDKKPEIPDDIPITIVFGNEDQKSKSENDEDSYIDDKMKELESVNQNSAQTHQIDIVDKNFDKEIIDQNKTDAFTMDGKKENFDLPDPEIIHNKHEEGILDFTPAKKDAFEQDPSEDINSQSNLVESVLHHTEEKSELDKLNTFIVQDEEKTKLKEDVNLDNVYAKPKLQGIDENIPKMGPEEIQNMIHQKLNLNPNTVNPSNIQHYAEEHNPDNIEIIHTPTVLKIDQNPKTIVKYDYGYGKDLRTRISNRKDFQDSKNNDEYKDLYHAFRTVSQLPYQTLKEQVQDSNIPHDRRIEQLKDINDENKPVTYNTPMTLKNPEEPQQRISFSNNMNVRSLQMQQGNGLGINQNINGIQMEQNQQMPNLQFNQIMNSVRDNNPKLQYNPAMNEMPNLQFNPRQNFQNQMQQQQQILPNIQFKTPQNNMQLENQSSFDKFRNKMLSYTGNDTNKPLGKVHVHDRYVAPRDLKKINPIVQNNMNLLNQNNMNLLNQNNSYNQNQINTNIPMNQNNINYQNKILPTNKINPFDKENDKFQAFTRENPGVSLVSNRMTDLLNLPKERSLFQGNKKNHWEKKADKVFRKLINGKL